MTFEAKLVTEPSWVVAFAGYLFHQGELPAAISNVALIGDGNVEFLWSTERQGQVVYFWVTFSNAVVIAGRLVREAWTRYCWEG